MKCAKRCFLLKLYFKGTVNVIFSAPHLTLFLINIVNIVLFILRLKVFNSDNSFMFFCSRSLRISVF